MPDTFLAWAMFAYFVVGAAGGWAALAVIVADWWRSRA